MSTLKYLLLTFTAYCLLYFAFVEQIEGAIYTAKFAVWVIFLLMLFLFNNAKVIDAMAKEQPVGAIKLALSQSIKWLMLIGLVWNGYIFTAIAQVFNMVGFWMFTGMVEDKRKQNG